MTAKEVVVYPDSKYAWHFVPNPRRSSVGRSIVIDGVHYELIQCNTGDVRLCDWCNLSGSLEIVDD